MYISVMGTLMDMGAQIHGLYIFGRTFFAMKRVVACDADPSISFLVYNICSIGKVPSLSLR